MKWVYLSKRSQLKRLVIPLPTIACLLSVIIPIAPVHAFPVSRVQLANTVKLDPEDIPEEILRQEIILDARSPFDGSPLTATEYAELQVEIERLNEVPPTVSPKLQKLVGLLKLRKFIKTFIPIIPIK